MKEGIIKETRQFKTGFEHMKKEAHSLPEASNNTSRVELVC